MPVTKLSYYTPKLNFANYIIAPAQGTRKIVEQTTKIINRPLKFIQPKRINSIFSQLASLFGKVIQTEEKNLNGQTITKIYKKHGITIEKTKLNPETGKEISTTKYNKSGIKTEEIFYPEDFPTTKYVNVYDPIQRKKLCKIKYNENGIAIEATKFNEHGIKTKKIFFDTDGKSPLEIYKYRGGKLVKHTKNIIIKKNEEIKVNISIIKYYNAINGKKMHEAHLDKTDDILYIQDFAKDGETVINTYGKPLPNLAKLQNFNNIA